MICPPKSKAETQIIFFAISSFCGSVVVQVCDPHVLRLHRIFTLHTDTDRDTDA